MQSREQIDKVHSPSAARVCSCDRIGQYYYAKTKTTVAAQDGIAVTAAAADAFRSWLLLYHTIHIKVMMKQQIENDNLIHILGKLIRII